MIKTISILGLVALFAAVVALGGDNDPATIADGDFSLYPGSVFCVPVPAAFVENDAQPGSTTLVPPMFEGAPPQVPHGIQEFLPIDREDNGCIACHLIEAEDDEDAPLLPESHRVDLRAKPPKDTGEVAGARWVCTACHVPLTDAKALPESAPQK